MTGMFALPLGSRDEWLSGIDIAAIDYRRTFDKICKYFLKS